MTTYRCSIHDKRPTICKVWPTQPEDLRAYPDCSFVVADGEISGECDRCGICCKSMLWAEDTPMAELINNCESIDMDDYLVPVTYENKEDRDVVCRFLVED